MSKSERLLADAKKAIAAVNSDTSVSPLSTRDSLEELREAIDDLIAALPDPDGGDEEEEGDED